MAGPTAPIRFRATGRSAQSRVSRKLRLGVPRNGQLIFFGDSAAEKAYGEALARWTRSAPRWSNSISSRFMRPRGCSMKGRGSPSAIS
jgi:hypothetical protein